MKHLFLAAFVLLFMATFVFLSLAKAGLVELKVAVDKRRRSGR